MSGIGASDARVGRSDVLAYLVTLLTEISEDWDVHISSDTRLGDLWVDSINVVYLIAEVQGHYGLGDALIARLRTAQIDVREVTVVEFADLVLDTLDNRADGREGT